MTIHIHRPRQAIGLIYIGIYIGILLAYAFVLKDDRSWLTESKFTATVFIWFLLSLAVKASMVMNRVVELLNVTAVVAFFSIGFTYHPNLESPSSIQYFCYYLSIVGGSVCDVFDFIYEGAAKRPENPLADPEK